MWSPECTQCPGTAVEKGKKISLLLQEMKGENKVSGIISYLGMLVCLRLKGRCVPSPKDVII